MEINQFPIENVNYFEDQVVGPTGLDSDEDPEESIESVEIPTESFDAMIQRLVNFEKEKAAHAEVY